MNIVLKVHLFNFGFVLLYRIRAATTFKVYHIMLRQIFGKRWSSRWRSGNHTTTCFPHWSLGANYDKESEEEDTTDPPPSLEFGWMDWCRNAQGSSLAKDDQEGEEQVSRHPPSSHTEDRVFQQADAEEDLLQTKIRMVKNSTGHQTSTSLPHWWWQTGRENPDSCVWKTDAKVLLQEWQWGSERNYSLPDFFYERLMRKFSNKNTNKDQQMKDWC